MSHQALPEGWKREEIKRSQGISSKIDVVYISPDGQKIRSKNELAKYLGHSIDLTTFDYSSGRINPSLVRKSKRSTGFHDYRALKNDPSMNNPVRQTACFFKHPVTVVRNSFNSKVFNAQQIRDFRRKHNLTFTEPKSDNNNNNNEKPFQMFWPKRLEGLRACNPLMEKLDDFRLPSNIRIFNKSLAKNEDVLRSIAAVLFSDNRPVRGQERKILNKIKKEIDEEDVEKNLIAFLNPHQPFSYSITITDNDIYQQEEIVRKCRQKLKETIGNR